jgi:hypothetical protein
LERERVDRRVRKRLIGRPPATDGSARGSRGIAVELDWPPRIGACPRSR